MNERLSKLRSLLSDQGLDAVIVSKPENRRYLSGFTGTSGFLVISQNSAKLITDFRYIEQAENQAQGFEIVRHGTNPLETVSSVLDELKSAKCAFESEYLTYNVYHSLQDKLKSVELKPLVIDGLRMIKDTHELGLIKTAVEIADAAFTHILSFLRPGITELAVAAELEYFMRKQGAERAAFDTIVASGYRGALPHGIASEKQIEPGDFVTMDFGAVYHGYHSDITRTVCIGKATEKQQFIYDLVLKAQHAGLRAVQVGQVGKAVDLVARQIIQDAGYGDYFGHGLGHGVGLAIHEAPALSPGNTTIVLAENMLVTVEPGVYLPDWGGVRIEDTVRVSEANCEILTSSDKKLIEIDYPLYGI